MLGGTIGEYKVSEQIGSSNAYKAIHVTKRTEVLIKRYNDFTLRSTLEVIKGINHENILPIVTIIEKGSSLYVVYESYPKETLIQYISNFGGEFGEGEIKTLLKQLVEACKEFESKGIKQIRLHPENIFINYKNGSVLMVGDIGLDETVNTLSKVWSIGIIMYYMLHNKMIYEDVKELPKDEELQYLVRKDASAYCIHLLSGCLQWEVEDRLTLDEIKDHPFLQESPSNGYLKPLHLIKDEREYCLTVLARYNYVVENIKTKEKGRLIKNTPKEEKFHDKCTEDKTTILACGHSLCIGCASETKKNIVLNRIAEKDAKCIECCSPFKLSELSFNL